MIGGLKKTTSRFAIAAAAGLFAGGLALTPAQAADLGGDCCADLEERVAELEATTVRKGNRKVSVKLSGQINYMLMVWDDGEDTDAYIVDNAESSSRFRFTGAAKFKPGWSAGFLMEVEFDGANGSSVSQVSDGAPEENGDLSLDGRKVAWYIKSDRLGEVWMGRYSPATDDIQLLNIAGVPGTSAGQFNYGGFFLRVPQGTGGCAGTGCLLSTTLGQLTPSDDTRRGELIRYNTPSLAGFVFSVSWGEDDFFDVAVRYKKEWNSIRIVGGIGYHTDTDETADGQIVCPDPVPVASGGVLACRTENTDIERYAGSLSAMHTPTGIYGYFGFTHQEFDDNSAIADNTVSGLTDGDREHYYFQLGVKRRWLAKNLGATTIYGEYGWFEGALENQNVPAYSASFVPGAAFFSDTEVDFYGGGIVQDIDKAAMQLWVHFVYYEPDADITDPVNGVTASLPLEEFWFLSFGGKIKF